MCSSDLVKVTVSRCIHSTMKILNTQQTEYTYQDSSLTESAQQDSVAQQLTTSFRQEHSAAVLGAATRSVKTLSNISVFIIAFFGTFLLGCFILSFQGLELMKTCSSVISLMSNTGLSFNNAGVTSNDFTMYSPAIKIFLSILMMVGRLELFTIIK